MIVPRNLAELLANDPLEPVQRVIVQTLSALLTDVRVVAHPGRVDLSELLAKSVATAPGIGIGWSRVRRAMYVDGSFGALVEWVAYIVVEAKLVSGKRVEKEAIGLAIGGQLLRILADGEKCFWGRPGIMPPERQPEPDLKPLFTVRDAANATAYYTVTWTQIVADVGTSLFDERPIGRFDPETIAVSFPDDPHVAKAVAMLAEQEGDDG